MSSFQCSSTTPSSSACWAILPTEVKAEIVRKMDLQTAFSLMRCGEVEKNVVRELGKFPMGVAVSHPTRNLMVVELHSKPETIMVQRWEVREDDKGSVVRLWDGSNKMLNEQLHRVKMDRMAFSIVRRLMSDKMFKVIKLEFSLNNYEDLVELNLRKEIPVKYVLLNRCTMLVTRSILRNERIKTDTWFLEFDCPMKMQWAENRVLEISRERELGNMAIARPNPAKTMFSPLTKISEFYGERAIYH